MIAIQLSGREFKIDEELRNYVDQKLGRLDKYLPRRQPAVGMKVEIFRDPSGREDNRYRVKVELKIAGPDLMAEAATMNPHAAVDIVTEKLKQQIHRYKDKHQPARFRVKDLLSRGSADDDNQ